jgi:hypothetical protein
MTGRSRTNAAHVHYSDSLLALSLVFGCLRAIAGPADPPAGASQDSLPEGNFFSSLKQAFKQDFDREVVRGHFEVGSPPDVHRYYCLVDAKTGKPETFGVAGQPALRSDGMTGITGGAVTVYSCVTAEQQGILMTSGYVLKGGADQTSAPASESTPPPPPKPAAVSGPRNAGLDRLDRLDIAGVKLGMTPDQVRAVLKTKKLSDYHESTAALSPAGARFVNLIDAWTVPAADEEAGTEAAAGAAVDAESFEVMFTPVPGRERAMAIVRTVAFASAHGVRESVLDNALVTKYGAYPAAGELPRGPTWRVQSDGGVAAGDPCNRRGLFGGLRDVNPARAPRQNLALNTTLEEFRFQIDHCGTALLTEDHSTTNEGAPRADRIVDRFTVTAYSPSIGLEGAKAAGQLIQSTEDPGSRTGASRAKDSGTPAL